MHKNDPTSLAQEAFRGQLEIFEGEFERFLVSLATPVEARRGEARETIRRISEIVVRLQNQSII